MLFGYLGYSQTKSQAPDVPDDPHVPQNTLKINSFLFGRL